MYKNFLLSLTLAFALILHFTSQSSAVTPHCPKSMQDLTRKVSDMETILGKCEDIDTKTGWSAFCQVNINTQAEHIQTAVTQAYTDCGKTGK